MKREKFIKLLKSNIKLMEFIIIDASSDNLINVKHDKYTPKLKEIYNSNTGVLHEQYNEFLYHVKSFRISKEYIKINKILDEVRDNENFYFNMTMDCYGNNYFNLYEITNIEQDKFEKFVKHLKKYLGKLFGEEYVEELKLSKEEMKECVKRAEKDVQTLPIWKDPSKNKGNKK